MHSFIRSFALFSLSKIYSVIFIFIAFENVLRNFVRSFQICPLVEVTDNGCAIHWSFSTTQFIVIETLLRLMMSKAFLLGIPCFLSTLGVVADQTDPALILSQGFVRGGDSKVDDHSLQSQINIVKFIRRLFLPEWLPYSSGWWFLFISAEF